MIKFKYDPAVEIPIVPHFIREMGEGEGTAENTSAAQCWLDSEPAVIGWREENE